MEKRQGNPVATYFGSHSVPLSEFWSILTSEIGVPFTHGTESAIPAGSTPALTTMETTLNAAIPVSTVTVDTTILRTSFVTVKVTTDVVLPTSCVGNPACSGLLPPIVSNKQTSLPSVVTKTTGSLSTKASATNTAGGTTSSAAADAASSSISKQQKHAIIGGLSGSIAGLVLIGILIVLFLRRRRKHDERNEASSEKGLRPSLARGWSQLTTARSIPNPAPRISISGVSTPDFDGGLIQMSLDHWERPFAHHASFRESIGPSRLRVMNPDLSRPNTPAPRASTESAGSFLRRQRSAVRAVLLGSSRSRASSVTPSAHRGAPVPRISIDPALSTEWFTQPAPTPSFRSYPSVSSFNVQHQPPEDPFVTPPGELADEIDPPPPAKLRRPSIVSIRSVAGAAGRTLGHVGNVLNLFHSKPNVSEPEKTYSRHSTSTFSSAGDPFRLDRPSMRASNILQTRTTAGDGERAPGDDGTVYEGT